MINAQQAREAIIENTSLKKDFEKQRKKIRLEGLLNQAVQEELNKNSSKVSRTLSRGSRDQADIIEEILREGGYKDISVKHKSEDHDRYVDYWIEIDFSF